MRISAFVSIFFICSIAMIWIYLILDPNKPSDLLTSVQGCYLPLNQHVQDRVLISSTGEFRYKNNFTMTSPYRDKVSYSLVPEKKIVADKDGNIEFRNGNPLLLRVDIDNRGFIIPSEIGDPVHYRKC